MYVVLDEVRMKEKLVPLETKKVILQKKILLEEVSEVINKMVLANNALNPKKSKQSSSYRSTPT